MSSGTIPATASGTPDSAPHAPETPARPGGLTSLMWPVEPPRPHDLPADTDLENETADGEDQPVSNGSSASFHDGDDEGADGGSRDALKKEKSGWKGLGLA